MWRSISSTWSIELGMVRDRKGASAGCWKIPIGAMDSSEMRFFPHDTHQSSLGVDPAAAASPYDIWTPNYMFQWPEHLGRFDLGMVDSRPPHACAMTISHKPHQALTSFAWGSYQPFLAYPWSLRVVWSCAENILIRRGPREGCLCEDGGMMST
ncbi:hypothetical protein ES702_05509 [subsurface metagenome]